MLTILIKIRLLYSVFMRWWNRWKLIIRCCMKLLLRIRRLGRWRMMGLGWFRSQLELKSWMKPGLLLPYHQMLKGRGINSIPNHQPTYSQIPNFSFYLDSLVRLLHSPFFGDYTELKVFVSHNDHPSSYYIHHNMTISQ